MAITPEQFERNLGLIGSGMTGQQILDFYGIPYRVTGFDKPNEHGTYMWGPGSADTAEGEVGFIDVTNPTSALAVPKAWEDILRTQVFGNSLSGGSLGSNSWLYDLSESPIGRSLSQPTMVGAQNVDIDLRDLYTANAKYPDAPAAAAATARSYARAGGDDIPSDWDLTQESREYLTQLAKKKHGFMKTVAPVLGSGLLMVGGAALAPLLGGGLGATGVGAGNSTSGLLGSLNTGSMLSGLGKGALTGYLSGGDLGSALKGGLLGGLGGGFGDAIGSAAGLGEAGQAAVKGALTGAAGPAGAGNYSAAALAGALGGGGSYITSGGSVPGLGSLGTDTESGYGLLGKVGSTLGLSPAEITSEGLLNHPSTTGLNQGAFNMGANGPLFNLGADAVRTLQASTPDPSIFDQIKNVFTGSTNQSGGENMNLAKMLGAGYEAYGAKQAEDKAKDEMMKYLEANQAVYSPYLQAGQGALNQLQGNLQSGYSYEDLVNDPGYQFQLGEGMKAIDRTQAARGGLYSGAALKEAMGYSQGLADQTYNDGFNRRLSENSQLQTLANSGQAAANAAAANNTAIGNVRANSAITRSNIDSALLAKLLGGSIFGSYL